MGGRGVGYADEFWTAKKEEVKIAGVTRNRDAETGGRGKLEAEPVGITALSLQRLTGLDRRCLTGFIILLEPVV